MLTDTHSARAHSIARPIPVVFLGSLILFAGLGSPVVAKEQATDDTGKPPIQVIVTKNPRERSSQFLSQDDPGSTIKLISQKEISIVVPGVQLVATGCRATVTVSYAQLDTIADVESTIENSDCDASSGSYTSVLSIRHENGELTMLEFEETWQRQDIEPVVLQREYSIGENVVLTRVRPRGIRCRCARLPQE